MIAQSSSVFKESRWIKGYWKPSRSKGIVAKNKVSGVLVHWPASSDEHPAYYYGSRNLTLVYPGDVNSFWIVTKRCSIIIHEPSDQKSVSASGLLR